MKPAMGLKYGSTDHAVKRARDRFQVKGSDFEVKSWISSRVDSAEFVGVIPDGEGKMRRCFIKDNVVLFLDVTADIVMSVRKTNPRNEWTESLAKIADKEIRKAKRVVYEKEAKLIRERYEAESEMCELKMSTTTLKSKDKIAAADLRICEIVADVTRLDEEIRNLRREAMKIVESFRITTS